MSEKKYINFPIQLISNFLIHDKKCFDNIMCYGCYVHSLKLSHGDPQEAFEDASDYYGITFGNVKGSFFNGEELYNSLPIKSPKVGISLAILWDYYKNYKSDFEKVTLLGFLAIKSIVQNKAYCKITNAYWISRMDGKVKSDEFFGLSKPILKYNNEYQLVKIKTELVLNWGLLHYSRYTRGFYVSFKLKKLDDLVFEAERRRKSTKIKQLKIEKQNAVIKALNMLESENTFTK